MKNWLLLLSLFCCFLSAAKAQLVFDKEDFEHKAGLLDEQTVAVYTFKNVGDTTIKVTNLSATCGCTVPQLDKKTYEPGETGEIKAVFTFGSRLGKQHKRIIVTTTGAGEQTHVLNLITHIPEWLELDPRVIRWNTTEPPSTRTMLVEVPLHEQIRLTMPKPSDKFDLRVQQNNLGKYSFLITPKSVESRVTEVMKIEAVANIDGKTLTREFDTFLLIR